MTPRTRAALTTVAGMLVLYVLRETVMSGWPWVGFAAVVVPPYVALVWFAGRESTPVPSGHDG